MTALHLLGSAADGGAETYFVDLTTSLHRAGIGTVCALRGHSGREQALAREGVLARRLLFGGPLDLITRHQVAALARRTRCEIFVADYRLAPEVPHPGGLDDCAAALAWLAAEADSLGVDRRRIALRGVSAGIGFIDGRYLANDEAITFTTSPPNAARISISEQARGERDTTISTTGSLGGVEVRP